MTLERVAHGGSCVAKVDGRVAFVRHGLPGERVRARITEEHDRYVRADAIEIVEPSPDRVAPPCAYAGPGKCGGCDWQHVALGRQRELKAAVVREQLSRLADLDVDVDVEALPDVDEAAPGLGWRTRVGLAVRPDGRAGLRRHRSHAVEPIEDCLIAHPSVRVPEVTAHSWPRSARVDVAVAVGSGERMVSVLPRRSGRVGSPRPRRDRTAITERAAGRPWRVTGGGFWQVHPAAAETLVGAVLDALAPRPGDDVIDLYAGVGLFAGALAPLVGPDGTIVAIESAADAVADAEVNLRDLSNAHVRGGLAADLLGRIGAADLIVLDPPRAGAGPEVMRRIAAIAPRRVAYVSCDPATLARDLGTARANGLDVVAVRAFDLFPMTAHVECVATLATPGRA